MGQVHVSAPLRDRHPARALIVTAGHIGNSIFCTPAIQLLRDTLPATTLDVVALNAGSAAVFADNAAISSVFVVRWAWQMTRLAARYDQVICLHPKSAFLLRHVTVPVSFMPKLRGNEHHAEQILAFAAALVGQTVTDANRCYRLATAAHKLALQGEPRIGIHLGCGRTAIHGWKFFYRKRDSHPKLWPTDYYVELAQQLRKTFPDAVFVLTGTRNERFLARRFVKTLQGAIDLTGKTSVVELAGLIDGLDIFITHDCGVLHVAASTNTSLLALFGPTCPANTGPWPPAPWRRILQGASMTSITPLLAAQAATELLQSSPAGQREAKQSSGIKRPLEKFAVLAALCWLPGDFFKQDDLLTWGFSAVPAYASLL